MGCNSSKHLTFEPQNSQKSRRTSHTSTELNEIQKNIQKLLNQQLSSKRNINSQNKSPVTSYRKSQLIEKIPDVSLSTILQPTETMIKHQIRKSLI